jgi:predicted membrane channel-forming protein YqfA (hemolysin III family)
LGEDKSSNWGTLALVSAMVAAGGIYDLATSSAPSDETTRVLLYILLGCSLIGLIGWLAKFGSRQ